MILALSAFASTNPGMIASNLALSQMVGGRGEALAFLNLEYSGARCDGMVDYVGTMDVDVSAARLVVGWGDFIHSRRWARRELTAQVRSKAAHPADHVESLWYARYMLEGPRPRRLLSYGSTLYTETFQDLDDPRYRRALQALGDTAEHLSFRDPVSVALVAGATGGTPELGCDCALLLDSRALAAAHGVGLPPGVEPGGYLLAAFGRSGLGREQSDFARAVARRLGLRYLEMNWLRATSDDLQGFIQKQVVIRNAACCISDIYHFCVCCLREGAPVLCMAVPGRADTTVDDEKKRIFFLSAGLRDYLADPTRLTSATSRGAFAFAAGEAADRLSAPAYRRHLATTFAAAVAAHRVSILEAIGPPDPR